jgi:hypothetical protein
LAIAKPDDFIDRRSWRIEIQIAKHHNVSGHSGSRVLVIKFAADDTREIFVGLRRK